MAEVFLGEATSVQGFKKRVAIKRVLPHLASHTNFIGMFLDEARLGARLSHANIVSVFDIGSAENTFFIVMEFIDGSNLKKIMETLRTKNKRFPLNAALYISMEACRGLSYAHELRDEDGKALELVHRDVSPPNILISRRGEVKVTDFGLAKARTQLERTDPGVVKGKFSYLSPEAGIGQPVDQRADIFALGVCLWEMLAGRRLFLGDTDFETVQAVTQAEVPSLIGDHPEVDRQLEALLMKSLARDPAQRFRTARELGDSLAGYLFSRQMKVTSYDIANLVKAALEQHKSIPPQPAMIDKMIQEELARFTSLDSPASMGIQDAAFVFSPDDEGARPLEASDFEDPSSWFEGDLEVEKAIETVRRSAPPNATMGWFESGGSDLPTSAPPARPAAIRESAESIPGLGPHPRVETADRSPPPTMPVGALAQRTPARAAPIGGGRVRKTSMLTWALGLVAIAAAAAAVTWLILTG